MGFNRLFYKKTDKAASSGSIYFLWNIKGK